MFFVLFLSRSTYHDLVVSEHDQPALVLKDHEIQKSWVVVQKLVVRPMDSLYFDLKG